MKLGDLIEKITTVTGIKKLVGDCESCKKRKKKMNKYSATNIASWIVILMSCVMILLNTETGNYQAMCDWAVIGSVVIILMFYSLTRKK